LTSLLDRPAIQSNCANERIGVAHDVDGAGNVGWVACALGLTAKDACSDGKTVKELGIER
jgi:hypothetical protein